MISTILFDFGGVFLNLDKPATLRELKKLGVEEPSPEMLKLDLYYEKGRLTSKEFLNSFQKYVPNVSEETLKQAWNAILLNFPEKRLEFLQELAMQKKYRLLLLSNTNEIHIDWIKDNIPQFEAFKKCFEGFYLSYTINARKPDPESYTYVLEKHGLKPEEVLFIDDTLKNTEAALRLGMYTWTLDEEKEDVTQLFTIKKELF